MTEIQSTEELKLIMLEIIEKGILAARMRACERDFERCVTELDHIHNLPTIVREFRPELLKYYLDIERVSFIKGTSQSRADEFRSKWEAISAYLSRFELE